MTTTLALLAAGVLLAAAVHCIRRAAHHVRALQREYRDATAKTDFDNHCDELLAIVHDTQPGRNENARRLLEEMWRQPAATQRNTGPRPRKEQQ
ncbi:hypothetical protein GCM10010400_76060 [Streptomyces aculeolatus]|uniref:hypothetical protein n=1 Tax=Streptomyces aculeolatus TaxID=270689 RepID=UPI001CEC05ED|nr:hypothetical protein [Streptomyces aculeolatus]